MADTALLPTAPLRFVPAPSATDPVVTPPPARFVLAPTPSPPVATSGSSAPARFVPDTPTGPSDLEQQFSMAKLAPALVSMAAPGTEAGRGAGAVGGALSMATGIQSLLRGNTAPGALGVAGGSTAFLKALGLGGPAVGALSGVTGLAGGAMGLAQGSPRGVEGLLSGGASIANLFPVGATLAGVPVSAAGGAAMGGLAASEAGIGLGAGVPLAGASIAGGLGGLGIPVIAFVLRDLINMGLDEYKQGDLSKRMMNAKQNARMQYGNQAQVEALKAAPSFQAAWRALSTAPGGTSGQVQFGIGDEYAGETRVGQGGTTQTSGWGTIIQKLSDPTTLANHPDLVASAIQNLWVQTGQGGSAAFDAGATRDYQAVLLSKLPNTPEWLVAKQKILNSEPVDPRDQNARDQAPAAPDLAVKPNRLRVNGLLIPTDHEYLWGDGATMRPYSPERVAQVLLAVGGTGANIFDKTTGKWVSGAGHTTDPAYLDPEAMATPWFKAKAQQAYDALLQRQSDDPAAVDPAALQRLQEFVAPEKTPPGRAKALAAIAESPALAAAVTANPVLATLLEGDTRPESILGNAAAAAGQPLGAEDYAAITGNYAP